MMKTSVLRQAAVCRIALTARPVHGAFRASSAALALSRSAQPVSAGLYRAASALPRFYSSEAARERESGEVQPNLITRFQDLAVLGVHERLITSITRNMRYETMTDVQSLTINPALAGKDIVAQAKTGTGKTLAFLIPIVQRILAENPRLASFPGDRSARSDDIRAIILSPTRELAEQIGVEAKRLVQGTSIVVQTAVGGTMKNAMLRRTRMEGCHLLVATPGRLCDLLSDTTSGIDAPRLSALVLDEADRMLDVGFKTELESILTYLPSRIEVPRQTLLYSATLPKNVVGLARQFIDAHNFEFVQTVRADEVPTHEKVPQFIVPCRGFENLAPTLLELIRRETKAAHGLSPREPFKAIVFLPTTASVVAYAQIFRSLRFQDRQFPKCWEIHSKLMQATRTRNAQDFRNADSAILFSSDVSARGMDFPNVSHVIQVHLPNDRDLYIHRIGRTGRAGKEGQAWLMVSDAEIPAARQRLTNLPIKRCSDLEAATVDVTKQGDLPRVFADVREHAQQVQHNVVREAYTSFLGGSMQSMVRQDVVNEINNWAKYTWGLDQPPPVSRMLMANMPRDIKGLRLAEPPSLGQPRDGDRGGFRGRGGARRDGQSYDGFRKLVGQRSDGFNGRRRPATF